MYTILHNRTKTCEYVKPRVRLVGLIAGLIILRVSSAFGLAIRIIRANTISKSRDLAKIFF